MKLTNKQLRQIIKEELNKVLEALEEPTGVPVDASRTEDDNSQNFDKSKHKRFGAGIDKDGVQINFSWNHKQQKYQVSYQLPYDYPGGGGGNASIEHFDDYEIAKARFDSLMGTEK